MDKSILVEVFVPTETGGKGNIATGYPVAHNRILTAGHILDRAEESPPTIQVRWRFEPTPTAWCEINGVIWDGRARNIDAVLLDCDFPEGVTTYGTITNRRPATDRRWESAGFAQSLAASEKPLPFVALTGIMYSAPDSAPEFELGVDYPVATPTGWSGMSGSPVFSDGQIIGLLTSSPASFEGRRFAATPTWKLLEDAEFRTAVGYDTVVQSRLHEIQGQLNQVLAQSLALMNLLQDEFGISGEFQVEELATVLGDRLITVELGSLLELLDRVRRRLLRMYDVEHPSVIALGNLVALLAPAHFEPTAQLARSGLGSDNLLKIPMTNEATAELLLAAIDGRPADFRSSTSPMSLPTGSLVISQPPDFGVANADSIVDAYERQLVAAWSLGTDKQIDDETRRALSEEIRYSWEVHGRRPYCVIPSMLSQDQERAFATIRERYPSLVLVQLSSQSSSVEEQRLVRALSGRFSSSREGAKPTIPKPAFFLKHLSIRNVRCFHSVDISFVNQDETPTPQRILLGDNAAGKTTILRCLAIGLCSSGDATTLINTLPGDLIRHGSPEASISIRLGIPDSAREFTITTRVTKSSDGESEIIQQSTDPAKEFPWERMFLCGYGVYRGRKSDAGHERYSTRGAVSTLFDPNARLQNPDVVLLKQRQAKRQQLEQYILSMLLMENGGGSLVAPDEAGRNLALRGPWGTFPISSLSDGFRSTCEWLLDFLGWSTLANRLHSHEPLLGILLIDEVEQHLHPKWQREFLRQFQGTFPRVQVIGTSHSPIVAGSVPTDSIIVLRGDGDDVTAVTDVPSVRGWRADQILTSFLFDLPTSRDSETESLIERYSQLLSERGPQDAEVMALNRQITPLLGREGEGALDVETYRLLEQLLLSQFSHLDEDSRRYVLAKAGLMIAGDSDD